MEYQTPSKAQTHKAEIFIHIIFIKIKKQN